MNTKSLFLKRFEELIANGVHMSSCLIDNQQQLQFSEFYGGQVASIELCQLNLFLSKKNYPDYWQNLYVGKQISIVISSPYTMETYQAKGVVTEIKEINSDEEGGAHFWLENFIQCLQNIGVSKAALLQNDYSATTNLSFKVQQLFMQTPARGTGQEI